MSAIRLPAGFTRWTLVPPGMAYVPRKGEWVFYAAGDLILRVGRRRFLKVQWRDNA